MFARIKLVSTEVETVALAPSWALGTDLGKRFVLVLTPNNHVEYRPVTLGPAVGELRVIRAGLKPGDKVVVSGLQKVKPGRCGDPVPRPPSRSPPPSSPPSTPLPDPLERPASCAGRNELKS